MFGRNRGVCVFLLLFGAVLNIIGVPMVVSLLIWGLALLLLWEGIE